MYTRFVLFTLGKGKHDAAKEVAGRFENAMKDLKGYKGSTFIADENIGEYGVLSMWETAQDAKQADASLAPDFIKSLFGQVQHPPIRRILEVFQP